MRFLSRVPNVPFMRARRLFASVSIAVIVASLAALAVRQLNFGIDFTGGVLVEVAYPESAPLEDVRAALAQGGFPGAQLQYFGTTSDILIRLAPQASESSAALSTKVLNALSARDRNVQLRRIEFVGPQVGEELAQNGLLAMLVAMLLILVYVWFRFEWKFSLGAIVATLHDVIITVGFFSVTGLEFDLTVLAAVLAVIGYSLNDTVVVFDRIRENFLNMRRADPIEVVNASVNQTLSRTIVTSGVTLLAVLALLFFGGKVIHNFSIAMTVGIVVGTYSSIFIASSLVIALGITREDLLPPKDEEIDALP